MIDKIKQLLDYQAVDYESEKVEKAVINCEERRAAVQMKKKFEAIMENRKKLIAMLEKLKNESGRICGEARDFAVDLDADDLMVTSGGATLSSISGEGCTMRMSMPWEAAVRAAAAVERIGMIAMIYVGETLLITPYDDLGFGSYKTNEGYLTSKKVVPSVAEYIADHHLSVDKIFVRSQDPVTLLRTRAILEQIPGIRVMSSAADNLEVITPAADKGTALGMLCRDIGTDLDHAAAIGDSENDFEMLRAVALPIAMGNASSEVKALCRWETDTNAEDGVAHAIDRILAHNKACDEQAENSGI